MLRAITIADGAMIAPNHRRVDDAERIAAAAYMVDPSARRLRLPLSAGAVTVSLIERPICGLFFSVA